LIDGYVADSVALVHNSAVTLSQDCYNTMTQSLSLMCDDTEI